MVFEQHVVHVHEPLFLALEMKNACEQVTPQEIYGINLFRTIKAFPLKYIKFIANKEDKDNLHKHELFYYCICSING